MRYRSIRHGTAAVAAVARSGPAQQQI
eukprot:COSAG03_NODE_38484_length_104_cov_42.000000_1_plen_26_part_10